MTGRPYFIASANCKYYAPELFERFKGKAIMIGHQCTECALKDCGHNLQAHGNKDVFALTILSQEVTP